MPRDVATLRTMEHATQAFILTMDGLPVAFTNDNTGELAGSGASSFIGRAESDLGETVGGREIREGLVLPESLEFGSLEDSLGLGRTTVRFSILLDDTTGPYFAQSGEGDEMLGRLAPTDDPAPASVVGVTVRDRYLGLEYVGANGERRMFPFLIGESLAGYDHHGDTDGETVPTSVSQLPLVHEGRLVALYRVYRDPSATFTTGSLAWPSLSNYRPIWVGKMRDAGKRSAGGRRTIECTGFESLLERNMATGAADPFELTPEATPTAGVDDQVAIYFGSGPQMEADGTLTARNTYEGRDWTTLSGSTREEIRSALATLIANTQAGTSTDYETGEPTFDSVANADAELDNSCNFLVRRDERSGTPFFFVEMRVAMHRRRWLALGYDPEQQDVATLYEMEDQKDVQFEKLRAGDPFEARPNAVLMGAVPGSGYYMGIFTTVRLGDDGVEGGGTAGSWDNGGANRYFSPLFAGADIVKVLKPEGQQVLRLTGNPVLLPQSHLGFSGSIDGTDCDAAGWFLVKGKIRRAEGETDDQSLIVSEEVDQAVIARCSWVVSDDLFADIGSGTSPALYVEELEDPRKFGYPWRPLDRDWATLELEAVQLHSFATQAINPEPMAQTLSALLRSTGTSTGPDGVGVIQQGSNAGASSGWYGDIFSPEMGLAIPDALLPTGSEIADALDDMPEGSTGPLSRCRISYEKSFSSLDTVRALLEPRALRVGFADGRFTLYRMRDASPSQATVHILESDLYGQMGDPTSVWPHQEDRALAPVDAWEFEFADKKHEVRAKDPGAATRRGDNTPTVNGRGLVAPELYGDDPTNAPLGSAWKQEARLLFGQTEARFLGRRHGLVTLPVSRPKGQDLMPGTIVTVSNPWIFAADGTQGVSGVVGQVVRVVHHTASGKCDADILVFEGQLQPPPHYAPAVRIWRVVSSTNLSIATQSNVPSSQNQKSGWERPDWATGGGGNARGALIRQLPTGAWSLVGTAEVSHISGNTVVLATPLTGMPPDGARTMMLVPDVMASQPEWFQEVYSAVGIQGDNTRTRRFI